MSFLCNPVWTDERRRVCRNSRRLLNDPQVFGAPLAGKWVSKIDRPGRDQSKEPGWKCDAQGGTARERSALVKNCLVILIVGDVRLSRFLDLGFLETAGKAELWPLTERDRQTECNQKPVVVFRCDAPKTKVWCRRDLCEFKRRDAKLVQIPRRIGAFESRLINARVHSSATDEDSHWSQSSIQCRTSERPNVGVLLQGRIAPVA